MRLTKAGRKLSEYIKTFSGICDPKKNVIGQDPENCDRSFDLCKFDCLEIPYQDNDGKEKVSFWHWLKVEN